MALADTALSAREPTSTLSPRRENAFARAAELGRELELRDGSGALVPADFIELTEWPGAAPEVAALLRLRGSHAPVPAPVTPSPPGGAGRGKPAT